MFWKILLRLGLLLFSLRYKIKVKGLKTLLHSKADRGILFLPNHPAHIDPVFLFFYLWPTFRMRPLVTEYIYRMPIAREVLDFVNALWIPDFDTSVSPLKVKKAEESIRSIRDGLEKGEHFILYPSGQLKSSGKEVIGGASATHALIQECKEIRVVLIRTTGLWGSTFSKAFSTKSPDPFKTAWQGIKTLLKNGLFFTPRRFVTIEIEEIPPQKLQNLSRIECNQFLERWFNQYKDPSGKIFEEEPIHLVSDSFWRYSVPEIVQKKQKKQETTIKISEEVRTKIYGAIRKIIDNPNIPLSDDKNLWMDLGMDSLNIAELIAYISKHYDVKEIHPDDIDTIQNVLEIAQGGRWQNGQDVQKKELSWFEEKQRPKTASPVGTTIIEAFLNNASRMHSFAAMGDDLIGVLTYSKLKKAVLVLAVHFQKWKDEKIAVMLPASNAAYLVILALECAGKIPVMLNWTLGPRYLDEMMRLSGTKRAITSWKFIDRLANIELGDLASQLHFLEEIKRKISLSTKLQGLLLSILPVKLVLSFFGVNAIKETDTAAILFTSGTESTPKGVPLSHKNILSNIGGVQHIFHFDSDETLFGVLPPFHSFGFTVTGLLPLLIGLRVAFFPDPTDGFSLAEGIERWKVTLFASAPSFLRGLFSAAKKEQLKTLTLVVSGAERAPEELFQTAKEMAPNAAILEGYGITECSPILTVGRRNVPQVGVGFPVPEVAIRTIHPETLTPLKEGEEGEVCVRGPNVFSGYLGHPRDPFIILDGKQWYRTGDIGYLKEGALFLSGRLKRFTKIGGEMISLGAIEAALVTELVKKGSVKKDLPAIALISDEKESGKPILILFSTLKLEKEEVNEMIKVGGIRLARIHELRQVEEIPLMGTGKIDYRKLEEMWKKQV